MNQPLHAILLSSAMLASSTAIVADTALASEVSLAESGAQVIGLATSVGVGFLGGNSPYHVSYVLPAYTNLAGTALVQGDALVSGDVDARGVQTNLSQSLDRAIARHQRQANSLAADPQRALETNLRSGQQLTNLAQGTVPATLASLPQRIENGPANLAALPVVVSTFPERLGQSTAAPALGLPAESGAGGLDSLDGWSMPGSELSELSALENVAGGLPGEAMDPAAGLMPASDLLSGGDAIGVGASPLDAAAPVTDLLSPVQGAVESVHGGLPL